jgi:hypothetical protein
MRLANVLLGDEEIAPVFATASAQVRPRLRVLPKRGKILTARYLQHGILTVFRIRRRKFMGLPDPDSSINKQKNFKQIILNSFVTPNDMIFED